VLEKRKLNIRISFEVCGYKPDAPLGLSIVLFDLSTCVGPFIASFVPSRRASC